MGVERAVTWYSQPGTLPAIVKWPWTRAKQEAASNLWPGAWGVRPATYSSPPPSLPTIPPSLPLEPAAAAMFATMPLKSPANAWKNANKSKIMIFFVNKQCSNSNLVWAVSRIHQRDISVEIFAYILVEHLLWNTGLQKSSPINYSLLNPNEPPKPSHPRAAMFAFPAPPLSAGFSE